MNHEPTQIRRRVLGAFARYVEELFAARPHVRSVLLCVGRGYAYAQPDQLLAFAIASERDIPVWPHRCARYVDDDHPWVAGESCVSCYVPERGEVVPRLELGASGWEAAEALAPFCAPPGADEDDLVETTAPFALARRGRPIELVGQLHDPAREMIDRTLVARPPPLDRRALELLDQIAAEPADDALRRVLADHLLERDDPRGEYLALALSPALDADAVAQRDALLAAHGWAWIKPLGAVVPAPCARFERGLLRRVDVWACDNDAIAAVRGASAWRTVEAIRFLGGSRTDLLDDAMRALRDVGPVDAAGIARLGQLALAQRLERVVAVLADPDTARLLARLELPRLRELVVTCSREWLTALTRAAWWPALERLTVLEPEARRSPPALAQRPPWLAVASAAAGTPTGWQVAHGPDGRIEVTLAGWQAAATFGQLRAIIAALPERSRILLVPSPWYAPDRAEASLMSRMTERTVEVAPDQRAAPITTPA